MHQNTHREPPLSVSLRPELGQFVKDQLRAGHYQTESDVVNDALEVLLQYQETDPKAMEDLRQDIMIGIEESRRGESTEWDVDEIIAEASERLASDQK